LVFQNIYKLNKKQPHLIVMLNMEEFNS